MDASKRIREFVEQNFYVAGPLGDDESLLDRGVVDSTGVLEIIAFVETELGVEVLDEEMTPQNLDGIGRIAAFVERKRAARVRPLDAVT
jgi:acyl carrier protein